MAQNKIFIGNLSFNAGESELRDTFQQFGSIESVAIPTNRDTGRPRGFGFITFESESAAKAALALDGTEIDSRKIVVNIAQDKKPGGGGGRDGGHGGRGRGDSGSRW